MTSILFQIIVEVLLCWLIFIML